MTPKRLSVGPLPEELATELRNLTVNTRHNNLDPSGDTQTIETPFTGEQISWVGKGTEEDVTEAFAVARRAQRSWVHVPFSERKRIFLRFHDLLLRNRELVTDMIQLETGKNRPSAFDEVLDIANNARYYANHAEKFMSPRKRRAAMPVMIKSREYRHPLGVVGQISPWNYPLSLSIGDAIPALLAGNAVVAKPDSNTPFTALLAFKLLFDAGLPRDLVQLVTGSGRVVGTAISEQCDFLMFTGSTATGKILGETMGRRLVGYSAELGGKNPLIIANDAKMDYTVRGALDACFSNSGQLCVSIERIYVERDTYSEFVGKFSDAVKAMSIGPGFEWEVQMGSLASQQQLDTVTKYVEDARDKGATIVAGGRHRPDLGPYFYEPTVLTDVPEDALLRTEEVFGPVVYIEPVEDVYEAIEKANDTTYGLNASVFGSSETAWRVAPHVEAGSVAINDGYTTAWAAIDNPMGGRKESGVSHRHGEEGLIKYTASQNISEQRFMYFRGPESLKRKTYAAVMSKALLLGKAFKVLP
ncbi:succinic semialdehyde dehydrogenase [Corynebacterium auriscanis]|uniref:Succinate-semialdehyde dehydrogenase n=1 Tax=Corynebacterium auriscanis TaxID=99807 RepID=A0A0A2DJH0_9CORY|nr:succinic semialdehyde dehydrogenase [Corynebacterium auriscanis]KGM18034.1 succinate-semialdehyde dehydrogenase [Corynebacterium auriscanis]MCX2162363.1 succinate-semialdehyde dehydrogenase (NADP(+)) [Corynebacterium auriscanis]WJY73181.1 Putative succinate-semialdehyde dehydrogenase [NADP(+)] 2 [Corynebacterium auriscanis]